MKKIIFALSMFLLFSCKEQAVNKANEEKLNLLAKQYVRLGLAIGQYDESFVDAYYGPDSLRPTTPKAAVFPKDSLLKEVNHLLKGMDSFLIAEKNDTLVNRAKWISAQLVAYGRRIKIFSGE